VYYCITAFLNEINGDGDGVAFNIPINTLLFILETSLSSQSLALVPTT